MIALALGQSRLKFNAVFGITVITLLLVGAIAGPWLVGYDPLRLDLPSRLAGPSARHLLGADEFGRDVLSRLVHGARTSAWMGLAPAGGGILR